MFRVVILVLALAPAAPATAFAQEEVPMEITSDSMRYDQGQNVVVFEGDVHAEREDMDIRARSITVHLKEQAGGAASGPAATGDIDKIVAEGNVRITQGERKGTSSVATYYTGRSLLVLEGDPVLTEGKNRIQGKVVRLYLKENRSEIEGGGDKRVEALFFTPKQMQEEGQEKE
jgi:lipopolysaccharide export system protein LptA